MKNLTMCPFTPYFPSLHCSVELNPSGQGQMDIPDGFFFFFSADSPPELCLGCCDGMFTSLVRSGPAEGHWSPRRSLRVACLVV